MRYQEADQLSVALGSVVTGDESRCILPLARLDSWWVGANEASPDSPPVYHYEYNGIDIDLPLLTDFDDGYIAAYGESCTAPYYSFAVPTRDPGSGSVTIGITLAVPRATSYPTWNLFNPIASFGYGWYANLFWDYLLSEPVYGSTLTAHLWRVYDD